MLTARSLRAAAALMLALIVAPVAPASAETETGPPPGVDRGSVRAGVETLAGMPWAKVYIPEGYRKDRPAPLAVLLHGSGDRGLTMIEAFRSMADRHGVILLAPDSIEYSWDTMVEAAHLRGVKRVPKPGADRQRIEDALKRAVGSYSVDAGRIALIGFSDGAGYGLSLGTNNAAIFHNVIAFAPGLLTKVEGQARGRVMLVHGTKDTVLPVDPTRNVFAPALEDLGFDVRLELFEGRHEMPLALREEAFEWWLGSQRARPDSYPAAASTRSAAR